MKLYVAMIVLLVSIFHGCAMTLPNPNVPFDYIPSPPGNESINIRVGMEELVDKRPKDYSSATRRIADVDEKVTAKLLEDFRSSKIFLEVDYPVQKGKDEIIIRGEVRRFYWKNVQTVASGIPFVTFLGVPQRKTDSEVNLYIQLVSSKTGHVIAEYDKTAKKGASYNLYNMNNQY